MSSISKLRTRRIFIFVLLATPSFIPVCEEVDTLLNTAQQHDDVELEAIMLRLGNSLNSFEDQNEQLAARLRQVSSKEEFELVLIPRRVAIPASDS